MANKNNTKFGKRGQAATEYLHTYGWVFLSAMVVGGVLIYYNFSSSKSVIPNECTFLSGISCLDEHVEGSLLSISIVNEFGFAISNISISVNGTCNSTANTTDGNPYGNPNVMLENAQANFHFDCQDLSDMNLEEDIHMNYVAVNTGASHVKRGHLDYSPTES
jgi:hypothetical protein